MMNVLEIGRLGEDMVASYLKKKGCFILRRNYFSRYGEIDIVAEQGEYILFVEVKTRQKDSPVSPQGAVSRPKQKRIVKTAKEFMRRDHRIRSCRFDIAEVVYEIDQNGEFTASLNYIRNAFSEEVLKDTLPF